MELLIVGQALWTRRKAVLVGMAVTIATLIAGFAVMGTGGGLSAATSSAQARVLVDTREPMAGSAVSKGFETIQARTVVLAETASTRVSVERIAHQAGFPPDELAVFGPSAGAIAVPVPLAQRASGAGIGANEAHNVVSLTIAPTLPIITIDTAAQSREDAIALAKATEATLKRIANGHVRVAALGDPVAQSASSAPIPKFFVLAGLVVVGFAAWCAALVVVATTRRRPPPASVT